MKNLFLNEFIKIKHSTPVKIVFALFLFFAVFGGMTTFSTGYSLFNNAYGAHFQFLGMFGKAVLFLFSPIVTSMITQEFSQGIAHNILSCGLSRKKYYFVKVICLMGTSLLVYLVSIVTFTLIKGIRYGFNPRHFIYPNYVAVVIVYHIGVVITIFAEMALFICIGYLLNRQAAAYLACIGAVGIEALFLSGSNAKPGLAVQTLANMWHFVNNRTVLTVDFLVGLLPSMIEIILFLTLAYFIFQRKNIK